MSKSQFTVSNVTENYIEKFNLNFNIFTEAWILTTILATELWGKGVWYTMV